MEINTDQINRVVIPRRSLAKRIGILWLFEIIAYLFGFGLFGIVSLFCVAATVWLTVKFHSVWRLYYHPSTLYILLVLLAIPAFPIGLGLRWCVQWLIFKLPFLIF